MMSRADAEKIGKSYQEAKSELKAEGDFANDGTKKKQELPFFEDMGFDRVIVDEFHSFKNSFSDDYYNDTEDGCHITSMAGTWLSVIKGFGGMRIKNDTLHFTPFIPKKWKSYSFRIEFRGRVIKVKVSSQRVETTLVYGDPFEIKINNESVSLSHNKTFEKVFA